VAIAGQRLRQDYFLISADELGGALICSRSVLGDSPQHSLGSGLPSSASRRLLEYRAKQESIL